jgi:hypothetical protein
MQQDESGFTQFLHSQNKNKLGFALMILLNPLDAQVFIFVLMQNCSAWNWGYFG